jgi:hypothetical protein
MLNPLCHSFLLRPSVICGKILCSHQQSKEETMPISIGLNIWSRLVDRTFPYLDQVVEPSTRSGCPIMCSMAIPTSPKDGACWPMPWAAIRTRSAAMPCSATAFAIPRIWPRWRLRCRRFRAGRWCWASAQAGTKEEYLAYGWPFPSARVRIAQLAESIELIRALWTQSPASYSGQTLSD